MKFIKVSDDIKIGKKWEIYVCPFCIDQSMNPNSQTSK